MAAGAVSAIPQEDRNVPEAHDVGTVWRRTQNSVGGPNNV